MDYGPYTSFKHNFQMCNHNVVKGLAMVIQMKLAVIHLPCENNDKNVT